MLLYNSASHCSVHKWVHTHNKFSSNAQLINTVLSSQYAYTCSLVLRLIIIKQTEIKNYTTYTCLKNNARLKPKDRLQSQQGFQMQCYSTERSRNFTSYIASIHHPVAPPRKEFPFAPPAGIAPPYKDDDGRIGVQVLSIRRPISSTPTGSATRRGAPRPCMFCGMLDRALMTWSRLMKQASTWPSILL